MRGDEFFVRVSNRPPFTKLHPRIAAFLKNYLAQEKVVAFGDRFVVNTNFPPYPSRAFDQMAEQFGQLGDAASRRLYSVTLAVTNRCPFNCWHCYNAGRNQTDMPLAAVQSLAHDLQDLGAVIVTLTGGEPLLRDDLAEIVRSFDDRSCLILGTTGEGLTPARARDLRQGGLFAVGISLDSDQENEHDRLRGREGAYQTALRALGVAREAGLYPYVVSVATREFLERSRFTAFLRLAASTGALEVHLLEPSATGRLAGRTDVLLKAPERQQIFQYQEEMAREKDLPIVSSFAYLESPEAFGCGAGLTHLYVDGSGEVYPCNLVPLSFGNLTREPFRQILDRMGHHFRRPRCGCVGRLLVKHFPPVRFPVPIENSESICREHLPREHALPAFFRIRDELEGDVGAPELRAAYDRVHQVYDAFWLAEAARPIDALIGRMRWTGAERVFEAGCGTGYATALLAAKSAQVVAADLSENMLKEARQRLQIEGRKNVRFAVGDALKLLETEGKFDRVFSSWVLGYIPLEPFFAAAGRALRPGGELAFIVHKENSPREPLEIFGELVAEDPTVLLKRVAFDFPRDAAHLRSLLDGARLSIAALWEGCVVFRYQSAGQVLEHLLKSGAGTAFYDAIDPARQGAMTERFLQMLIQRKGSTGGFEVRHEYLAGIARNG